LDIGLLSATATTNRLSIIDYLMIRLSVERPTLGEAVSSTIGQMKPTISIPYPSKNSFPILRQI
jgi:hypothetical protein